MREWLLAYVFTCAIEIPIVVLLVRALGWRSPSWFELVAVAWALQLTHPLLWLIRPENLGLLMIAEALIVVVEALLLWAWATARADAPRGASSFGQAAAITFVANGASLVLGLVVTLLAGFGRVG